MLTFQNCDLSHQTKSTPPGKTMKFNPKPIKYQGIELGKEIKLYKIIQRIAIKRIKINIEIKNTLQEIYFLFKGDIENKN